MKKSEDSEISILPWSSQSQVSEGIFTRIDVRRSLLVAKSDNYH